MPFGSVEDGASPEAFMWGGRLHVALVAADACGDGWVGLRRYDLADRTLVRDTAAETAYPVTGGVFRALPGAIRIANAVDGCAIVRNATNDPVVRDGAVTVWRGWRASLERTDTWRIVREPGGLVLG